MDGTGIQPIADPGLAQQLLDKVNSFNKATALQSVAIAAALATAPEVVALIR